MQSRILSVNCCGAGLKVYSSFTSVASKFGFGFGFGVFAGSLSLPHFFEMGDDRGDHCRGDDMQWRATGRQGEGNPTRVRAAAGGEKFHLRYFSCPERLRLFEKRGIWVGGDVG